MQLTHLLDSTLHYQQHQRLNLLLDLEPLPLTRLAADLLCLQQLQRL
jgi:hypothetical protein